MSGSSEQETNRARPRKLDAPPVGMAPLLQFFPDQGHHAHFAVARKGCWMGDISDPIAVALNFSDVRRSGPHLVPSEIDVLGNLGAVERIGAAIGCHRSVKISALQIGHCLDRFRLRSSAIKT
jgi:hypothetical protein